MNAPPGTGRGAWEQVRGSAPVSALAVLLTATAFSGVLADSRWLPPVVTTVAVVSGTGLAGRALRWWPPLVAVAQLAALAVLLVCMFSGSGVLGVLPGPAALGELGRLLGDALAVVRTGVPPVPAEPPLQCLVSLGVGLVAVLVDTLVAAAGVPAAAGLVLLCVFAVPAALADDMLPWWSFVAGAFGFALLLAGGVRRRACGKDPGGGHAGFGRQAALVSGLSVVVALLVGSAFTGVGTQGRLPGFGPDDRAATSGIGLNPFTSLRGQLNRDDVVTLFRVRGLPEEAYLRALTLREFAPESGWKIDGLTQGVDALGRLPYPEGLTMPTGRQARIEIEPVGYRDPWLPTFGVPLDVDGITRGWRYDPASGVLFTQSRQQLRRYTERILLPEPSPAQLRHASGPVVVDPAYLDIQGVAPEVVSLAERLTAGKPTNFDKAVAINRFFTDPDNGFHYDLQTAAPSSSDALADFLFHGKRGYCEQFASAMGVLLRSAGIPARVAVGFTSGYRNGDVRVITTEDAHAWVEAFFPGFGWVTFDPTPLGDGRTALPSYLDDALPAEQSTAPAAGAPSAAPEQPGGRTGEAGTEQGRALRPAPQPPIRAADGGWWRVLGVSVLVLALAAAPALLREVRRRRRLRAVGAGAAGAADIAWQEVMDASWDRGSRPRPEDTARAAALRLSEEHGLDTEGVRALHALVNAVEREWYGPPEGQPGEGPSEALAGVLAGLGRNAPLDWRSRLFPRSVLRPGATRAEEPAQDAWSAAAAPGPGARVTGSRAGCGRAHARPSGPPR